MDREKSLGFHPQRENIYNRKLPHSASLDADSQRYLQEIKLNLSQSILNNDIDKGADDWVRNLHKYIIMYGLKFSKEDHIFFIKVIFGLMTTKHVCSLALHTFAKVLHVLMKKKYLVKRHELTLPWEPLFELYKHWEDSSFTMRGLLKPAQGFKSQLTSVIKVARHYFSEESTQEMLDRWRHMMCPHDRSICQVTKYYMLFLPTTSKIPPDKSWKQWVPDLNMFWKTWSNSPNWEVDILKLFARLSIHQAGEMDWEPYMGDMYTRFMNSFNLPVTYGSSGVRLKHGMSGQPCINSITQWIIFTLGPGSSSQDYLTKLLTALQSYYHPANTNNSSEELHLFISCLTSQFVSRVHVERYNTKWECRIKPEKRLTDDDIQRFVLSVKPIAMLVLYNSYEEDARAVFSSLSVLAPSMIIPDLLEKLAIASQSLTEPHRFHVCIQALSSVAGPMVRNYPEKALELLTLLLPGITVNDIWKCTDIFVLMSDLLEMIPVADLTCDMNKKNYTEEERNLALKTVSIENFVAEFMDRCFTLIENSRRENIRSDAGVTDDYLNDEELAADAAINDTFLRIVANSSPAMYDTIFRKLQVYIQGKIVEPTVAGGILASMCKSVVQCNPEKALKFFVPYLCQSLTRLMEERDQDEKRKEDTTKVDEELQFNLQLLGEVLNVKNLQVYRCRSSDILPHIAPICQVIDMTLDLAQKEEYELSHTILQNLITWLCRIRLVECSPRIEMAARGWGRTVYMDQINVDWNIPNEQELGVVRGLLDRYLTPLLVLLDSYSKGEEQQMSKETLQRKLKLVCKIILGVSELVPPEQTRPWDSVLSSSLLWLDKLSITLPGPSGEVPLRQGVNELLSRVQKQVVATANDDYESLGAILNIYDVMLFCYGMDEEEIGDHLEDQKRDKNHREDRLVREKKHLPSVILERICIQWETHLWLKNLLVIESFSPRMLNDLFSLCVHQYSEVRVLAQEILLKVVGRVGKECMKLIVPRIVECLHNSPEITEEMMKGALYLINQEKYMFFYSWELASKLWPALVTAQHRDKQSIDDLLRDIGIKMSRYYQDYCLYTIPLSSIELPGSLLEIVKQVPGVEKPSSLANLSLGSHLHFQELERRIIELVSNKNLHWRHHEMAVGMLLTMITYDSTPTRDTVSLWLKLLLDDQRSIRCMANQAMEGVLKLEKMPSRKVPLKEMLQDIDMDSPKLPGIREDNLQLQYRNMEEDELKQYWNKPFIVKSYMGYWTWPKNERVRLAHRPEDFNTSPDSVRSLISQFFLDENLVARFVELNSLEHEKGLDFFNMDRGIFMCFLFENIGPKLGQIFQCHIEKLVCSPEESQQRAAAEMVYGLVRGMRFWDYQSAQQAWTWLIPVFQQVLSNVTLETQSDWDLCFSGASNKGDPNRLRPMLELLVTSENLVSQGAFKESSYLLFVTKCLSSNWRARDLFVRTYNILRQHWDHPYNNVRHQIANTMSTLLCMDIPLKGSANKEEWNIGDGFPTKKTFLDEIIPMLNLHHPNPEFSREETPVSGMTTPISGTATPQPPTAEASPNTSSEDISMTTDVDDEETKRSNRILETASLWLTNQIRNFSSTMSVEMFRLLPYLCQFIGTEKDQDVSQSCLQALCYLSICILPEEAIQPMLDMVKRIVQSSSYKTKMSVLEFVQVSVFTNFLKIVVNASYKEQVQTIVINLLQDDNLTVRIKAGKILGGLLHSGFIDNSQVQTLLTSLRSFIRPKMTRRGKKFIKPEIKKDQLDNSKDKTITHHAGIIGLCAFVEAFPYDVPDFVPPVLMELSTHLNDSQPIPTTIKKCLQEFKRTHQDNWQEHKTKFTEDQLLVMTDLLVSQNYYA